MFNSIGWGEIVVLALAALFIFGPDRLPSLAKDAATGIKKAREAITGVRGQLHDTLGDDFDHLRDVTCASTTPRRSSGSSCWATTTSRRSRPAPPARRPRARCG